MSIPLLSICMTAFRKEKWYGFYQSILNATTIDFELIIVSPHQSLPDELRQYTNIKHLQDFGPPMRCAQIAASLAEGEILNILPADDGLYLPNSIDEGLKDFFSLEPKNYYKNVLCVQYIEGQPGHKIRQPNEYYLLNYHAATRLNCIPNHYIGLNNGFIYRKYFRELGGWDCRYETCPLGLADLAIRIQRDGGNMALSELLLLDYDWYPADSGDHKPIFDAQTQYDEPLYHKLYDEEGYNKIKIPIENWKKSPAVWSRRTFH